MSFLHLPHNTIMESILTYFPDLSDQQIAQFEQLKALYEEWNAMINVISRKDIDQLYIRHVLHSLSISLVTDFKPFTKVIDIGTGGGFPGIPLAILYPQANFYLIDSIGKKIKVVQGVIDALKLKNVSCKQTRAEQVQDKFDFAVSRAVAKLPVLYDYARPLLTSDHYNKLANGLICLKGGNIKEEMKETKRRVEIEAIKDHFDFPFFEEKYVVYVKR